MLRKPGAYRNTSMLQKALSMLQKHEMDAWQRPFWNDIRGASLRNGHPAPFPPEIAERLIRMFSFSGARSSILFVVPVRRPWPLVVPDGIRSHRIVRLHM